MTDECQICFDKFNGSSRKKCVCQYCNMNYCRECVGAWLTTIIDEPRCPNNSCKKAWSREYTDSIMTKVWRDTTYREYREKLLMDRERALLPSTQPRIEAINEANRLEREVISQMRERRKELQKQVRLLQLEDNGIQTQVWDLQTQAARLRSGEGVDEAAAKTHKAFVRRCPSEGCRGFLSTAWKCGVCELYSCSDCHDVKGAARDSEHTCDPNNVETAKLLAKDTKACPKCGEMITKIDGCDQMWCVSCHTAFSWRTGQAATGIVHNPHFYEWQRRQGNGEAPRVAGDIPCGGLIDWTVIRQALMPVSKVYPAWISILELAHRRINHVLNVDMRDVNPDANNVNNNIDLRIEYLLKQIGDEAMMTTLIQREKKLEKDRELRRIYETLTGAAIDIFRRMYNISEEKGKDPANFQPLMAELDELRKFINEALDVLRRRYNATIHGFDTNWERLALKKKREGEIVSNLAVKTIYGTFVDEVAKYNLLPIEAPGPTEDGRLKFKKHYIQLRKLTRLSNAFPDTGDRLTMRLAQALINYYEYGINIVAWSSGTRTDNWQRDYYARLQARPNVANAVELWKKHVETLELTMKPIANTIE